MRDLRMLLDPVPLDVFLADYWGKRTLHLHGSPERFDPIFRREDWDRMVAAGEVKLRASLPDPGSPRGIPEAEARQSMDVRSDQIPLLVRAGATISMTGLASTDLRAARVARMIKRELGFAGEVRVSAWLSPSGHGVAPHFDAVSTFIFQIEGTKTWRVSQAPAIPAPRQHCALLANGQMVYATDSGESVESESWEDEIAPALPESLAEVELAPGDVFYVPAGTWHMTEASSSGPSLSLNLHLSPVSFFDVLDPVLREVLGPDPSWRTLPVAPSRGRADAPPVELVRFFDERLTELRRVLDELQGRGFELAKSWQNALTHFDGPPVTTDADPVGPDDRLRLREDALLGGVRGRARDGVERVFLFAEEKQVLFDDPALLSFGEALLTKRAFTAREAAEWSAAPGDLTWDSARDLLEALLEKGLLERVPGE